VMVNNTQVADVNGNMNFNPVTNTDPWETKEFDLSQFGNTQFSITFQSACYLQDKFYAEGDNVLLDNIMISNTTGTPEKPGISAGILTYPNPVHDQLNFSAGGVGANAVLSLMNTQGQVVYSQSIANYRNGESRSIVLPSLNSGIYILRIAGDQGVATKKILVK
jgi:hypothetical protein